MSSISIIGAGNMARAIGTLALEGGNTVEIIGRDAAKAAALAGELGRGTTTGKFGAAPAGDIVILAVLYDGGVPAVTEYGEALAGKIIIDISNAFAPDAEGLLTPPGVSAAEQVAAAAPRSAHVIKAFNTVFGHVLAASPKHAGRIDAFFAGDDTEAKARVSTFLDSLGLRPLDIGPLTMARSLEQAGLLIMGVARHGAGHFNFALGITEFD